MRGTKPYFGIVCDDFVDRSEMMSLVYLCDQCKKEMGEPEITVHGLRKMTGDILLPDKYLKHHFCGLVCMLECFGLVKVQERLETKE